MKILITGGTYGLGKNINETMLDNGYDTHLINSTDLHTPSFSDSIDDSDVFINNEYKDKIQTELFEYVYNKWKYKPKTIINILTSALVFDGPNKKYIEDKRDLEQKTINLRTDDKEVRIINVYPNTLESSKSVPNQKLNYSSVSNLIEWIIKLPQDIEIFQIGISKTKLKIESQII
jgi:NADP-dependent 3-hydroxy acid dehydrogenase YdfG